jgi:hypothetical protein
MTVAIQPTPFAQPKITTEAFSGTSTLEARVMVQTVVLHITPLPATAIPPKDTPTPAPVPTVLPTDYAQMIAAGSGHTCLVTATGGVKCWGANQYGQLGTSAAVPFGAVVDVEGLRGGVAGLAAGAYHTCVIASLGAAWCWGKNASGQLGDGTTEDRSTPVQVPILRDLLTLTAGFSHTCARNDSLIYCWGDNHAGQLGGEPDSGNPVVVVNAMNFPRRVAAHATLTCGVDWFYKLWCWGANPEPSLTTETLSNYLKPHIIQPFAGKANSMIAVGTHFVCAFTTDQLMQCWGAGLTSAETYSSAQPLTITGFSPFSGITQLVAGDGHSCALLSDGNVVCWGDNYFDQLGNGTFEASWEPVPAPGIHGEAVGLAAGAAHTCALLADGRVTCWGDGSSGQLGDGTVRWK